MMKPRGRAEKHTVQLLQEMDDYHDAHDLQHALLIADELLRRKPLHRPAMERVTSLYIDLGDAGKAAQALAFLLENFPLSGYFLFFMARIEYMEKDYSSAIEHAKDALQRRDTESWQDALLHNILGRMYRELGEAERASAEYLLASSCPDNPGMLDDYSNYLFSLHYHEMDREKLFREIQCYNTAFSQLVPFQHERRMRHKKLRIGYISPDLRFHVVAFFSYAFFKSYDKAQFEVYCYAKCKEDDASREFAAAVDGWRNILCLEPETAARQIYADGIDILVDLSGHTANNCLPILAYKPAPVQISGVGWFNSTGLKAVDYFLADNYTDPPGLNEAFFTEKLLRLPHSHFCYMWHGRPGECPPAPYRKNGWITFGCLNNFAKVTDTQLQLWAKILAAVPRSKLLLKAAIFDLDYGRSKAVERLQQAGIPMERTEIEGYTADYLDTYARIDIALDTFPYPGGGTTCDALYMGVPVITLKGNRHGARFGYSLLMNLGLQECCADTPDEYAAKAVALAYHKSRVTELHQTIRRRMQQSPVMDDGLYMAELEQAYQRIWQDWLYASNTAGRKEAKNRDCSMLQQAMKERQWQKALLYGGRLSGSDECPRLLEEAMGMSYSYLEGRQAKKRAAYWLHRAIKRGSRQRSFLNGLLADMLDGIQDYGGAYRAVHEALSHAGEEPRFALPEYRQSLYSHQAQLALCLGYHHEALEAYCHAADFAATLPGHAAMLGSAYLTAHYLPLDSAEIFSLQQSYQELFRQVRPLEAHGGKQADERIHLGYLSADFRCHVLFAFYYAMLFCYDKQQFHVSCYSLSAETDAFTQQIQQQVDVFVDVSGRSFADIAQRVHEDGIDILVDLSGHSSGSGLPVLAWKPAPVQISGLGYMASTTLPAVDYFITDQIVDPPGQHEQYFTEQLLYLPSQFSYTGRNDVPASQGAPCREKGYVTFGVFNHYRKITDEQLSDWLAIMQQAAGSRLLLKSQELVSDSLVELAYERMKGIGFDMDRVAFEPATLDYMERYLQVDIALDTYPYPGGGTTCDALYMGVPVITRYGERRNTRFGLSILQNIGLEELAADNRDAYIACAAGLAADTDLLDVLHRGLRQMLQSSDGMEPRRYMRNLEKRYEEIWQKYEDVSRKKGR